MAIFWSFHISTNHTKLLISTKCGKIKCLSTLKESISGEKKCIVILRENGMSKKYEKCKRQNSVTRLTYPEKEI